MEVKKETCRGRLKIMGYSVVQNKMGRFDLLEKESKVLIELSAVDETKVRATCRKLNLGSGFNGWTPEFLARKLIPDK